MEIKCNLNDLVSPENRPYIVVLDRCSGKRMKSYGEWCGYSGNGKGSEGEVTLVFKTAENESQVKEVTVCCGEEYIERLGGEWMIKSMMRNRLVPREYEVVEVGVVERYSSDEREKREVMLKIHESLSRRCGEYVFYSKPVRIELGSIGKVVEMEYFTKDWFGIDDIINYRTDHVRMSSLSVSDLKKVYAAM